MDDRDDYMKKIFMFQFVMLLLQFNFDRLEVPHILFNCFDKLHQENNNYQRYTRKLTFVINKIAKKKLQ